MTNPWKPPKPGRHRAPVIDVEPVELHIRRRHVAVVALAIVAFGWLPAELADSGAPTLLAPMLAPPAAQAAENPPPPNPTDVIQPVTDGVVRTARTAAESLPAVLPSPSTPEPPASVETPSGPVPTLAPAPVVTTTAPAPAPATTTQPAPPPTTQPVPTRAWPPNCGSAP